MFGIIALHVIGNSGKMDFPGGITRPWVVAWWWEIVAYCSVDVFALISGYVGFEAKFKWGRIVNIWIQAVFYLLSFYTVTSLVAPERAGLNLLVSALFPFTSDFYWYLTAYAGMYVFIPIMNKALDGMSHKQLKTFFLVIVLLFCVAPLLLHKMPYGLMEGYAPIWLGIMYMLGGYIRRFNIPKKLRKKKIWTCIFGSCLILFTLKIVIDYLIYKLIGIPKYGGVFISYISPLVVINAVMLLCLFSNIEIEKKFIYKAVISIARGVLGVYLIHTYPLIFEKLIQPFIDYIFSRIPLFTIGLAIICVIVFVSCEAVELVRMKLFHVLHLDGLGQRIDKKLASIGVLYDE